jgi:hypothetical protein
MSFTYLFLFCKVLFLAHNELATPHARLVTTHYELDTAHARLVLLDFVIIFLSFPPSSSLSSLFFLDIIDLLDPTPFPCTLSLFIVPFLKLSMQ